MKHKIHKAAGFALCAGLLTAALDIRLKVVEYTVISAKATAPVRLAVLSDLHNCRYGDGQQTLLKAVAKAESNYNANAVSAAGAQGVMQLMPATAKSLGVDNPFDARSNIMGGAKYISQKLNQYDGDVELALAAYNAGSGNVAKYGGVPPFTETRNYIKRIKEYMGGDLAAEPMELDQTYARQKEAGDRLDASDAMEVTELAAQYLLGRMQLQMQDQMNSLSASLAGEEEEEGTLL